MKYEVAATILAFALSSANAIPHKQHKAREVPQEHSHNAFLDLVRTSLDTNNPLNIADPVFGLLGNAAAAGGAGDVTDLDCLQQATADQAFTNAKAAGDLAGMAGALVYRALERNTASVGLASVACTEAPVNAEIAALSQHQDPASANAASINKGITIALAQQLAAIGADPLLALESGTFAPGTIGDPTAAGNTCDTSDDEPGCIYSENLLVLDATEDEISSAVATITPTFTGTGGISATDVNLAALSVADATAAPVAVAATSATDAATECAASADATTTAAAAATSSCTVITTTLNAAAGSTLATVTSAAAVETSTAASGTNVQTFTGTLGGAPPPVISSSGDRPFSVEGDTFVNAAAALQRSCSVQHNACANAANSGALAGGEGQCETQEDECNAADGVTKKLKRATDFGSCGNPTILFEAGLDGRNTDAFIAQDQTDFNHGSALNIAVVAGFICQRLGSPCDAPADVQASCTSASAAAVATTQNQAAADVFNSILVGGDAVATAAASAVTTAAAKAVTAAASAVVMTITSCT
ncbi:hypothetical protein LTR10_013088 [Elasticomyces elasticus]|uniref:Cell wall protein n=1 Tax=Exophiala sideris TaxID=1016849 RepID=A0ABR0JAU1_9EURO|nr:hypothetical protein LTR10_013088 [Elasticomyces elasticus]KAK5030462.1 hypothetical protein LTS07_005246 [Exophiala sideris]KAK5038516.1 hypothetical protein LTR13_004263 [Exophiala sideris]KAK5060398.1 hypothetical protein LTR69_005715 [Exophiala sideris]KAK5183309.1 hypothetical protein LTR44_004310 [Eurotiomycetes sp. CCFEE 6388]